MTLKYISSEAGPPNSFDPLDADKTQNQTLMSLIYTTPVFYGRDGSLRSAVLSEFSWEPSQKIMRLGLRNGVRFQNGEGLTTEDLAMAICRLGYFRPDFPVIRDIVGLGEWAERKQGLYGFPSGVRLLDDALEVHLDKEHENPLARLSFTLFSIVPAASINRKTGELVHEHPPESGMYYLKGEDQGACLLSERVSQAGYGLNLPFSDINIEFKRLSEARLSAETVISGNDSQAWGNRLLKGRNLKWLPSSRVSLLRFCPLLPPFNSKECREFFATLVRIELRSSGMFLESSFFPDRECSGSSEEDGPFDFNIFKSEQINIACVESLEWLAFAAKRAAEKAGLSARIVQSEYSTLVDGFVEGKIAVMPGAIGFSEESWFEDFQMWATPGLHKTMTYIWGDKSLYDLIEGIKNWEFNDTERKVLLANHLRDSCLISPISRFRRFLMGSDDIAIFDVPHTLSTPPFWELVSLK